jgi:hypothetical protein
MGNRKVRVKLNQNSLAVLIKINDIKEGYIFHGEGRLILDAILIASWKQLMMKIW